MRHIWRHEARAVLTLRPMIAETRDTSSHPHRGTGGVSIAAACAEACLVEPYRDGRGEVLSIALLRVRCGRFAEGRRRGGDEDGLRGGLALAVGVDDDVEQDPGRRQIDGGDGVVVVEAVAEQGDRQSEADGAQYRDRWPGDGAGRLSLLHVLGLEHDEADRQQAQRRQEGGLPAEEGAAEGEDQNGGGKSGDKRREESHTSNLVGGYHGEWYDLAKSCRILVVFSTSGPSSLTGSTTRLPSTYTAGRSRIPKIGSDQRKCNGSVMP